MSSSNALQSAVGVGGGDERVEAVNNRSSLPASEGASERKEINR